MRTTRCRASALPKAIPRSSEQHAVDTPRRPRSITAAAWLFILVGAGGILKDVLPLAGPGGSSALKALLVEGPVGLALIWTVRLLAVVGGVLVLDRRNAGRWLLAAWMACHIALSLLHSLSMAAAHVVIFAGLGYVLFRAQATRYFLAAKAPAAPGPGDPARPAGR